MLAVVGARPNFVKSAPVIAALEQAEGISVRLLHTGQHYDRALSGGFIERLGMREPDANLGVGSGSHAEQTAGALTGVEADLLEHPADLVLVAGDVNSTLAAALAATKLHIAVAHIESGLRSRDWAMPEEVNRVLTDRISDVLLCTSQDAVENLAAEGITRRWGPAGRQHDDRQPLPAPRRRRPRRRCSGATGSKRRDFVLVTLHRPALVDDPERLGPTMEVLAEIAGSLPVIFPAHPRTRARPARGWVARPGKVMLVQPMDYDDFIALEAEARLVITDSGGVQEETTRPRHPLPHLPDHHGAADHGRAGHQRARRGRSGGAAGGRRAHARRRAARAAAEDPALGRQGRPPRRGRRRVLPRRLAGEAAGKRALGEEGGRRRARMETASRTLVKSPPEVWEQLDQPERMQGLMCALLGRATDVTVYEREEESTLAGRPDDAKTPGSRSRWPRRAGART